MNRMREGYSLVEVSVALGVGAILIWGLVGSAKFFTRPVKSQEATLDRLQDLSVAIRSIDSELRAAREILFPAPGDQPRRILYYRDYSGRICAFYFSPDRGELRKATFDLAGLPVEARTPPARQLDDVYFSHSSAGLLSWGFFAGDVAMLGSVYRENL